MKALSKPISSPSRADKFPPPLFRFLRSNVGSRSRGRSRSSPMFYNRSKRTSASRMIETTQEPSSPKVTCIGQVRVRRSGKSKPNRGVRRRHRRPYWWFKKTLLCGKISTRFRSQKRYLKRAFCKWGLFFGSGYCKKVDANEDSFRVCSNQRGEKNEFLVGGGVNKSNRSSSNFNECGFFETTRVQESNRDFLESPSSPPKNALILTRCRSAPYRSSSLGGKFWGSPLAEKTGDHSSENEAKLENHSSENVVEEESRISDESSKELENSSVSSLQELKVSAVHPLLLTRCKSEPARTGERLNPETNFRRQKRCGVVEPCLQHSS